MKPPEALAAARELIDEAWDLLRYGEGVSGLQLAWDRHVSAAIGDENDPAQEAVFYASGHQQDYGYRVGLLVAYLVLSTDRGQSQPTAAEVAKALVDAAAWQDADADERSWPQERLDDLLVASVPKMAEQERRKQQATLEVLHTVRRAAEVAVVGDATAAATKQWRSRHGVDLETATPEQMIELDRLQQAAKLQARARLERILDKDPAWWA